MRRRSVDEAGAVQLVGDLLDAGTLQMTVHLTVTADRAVRLMVHGAPGAQLNGFQAWSDF